jgi:hypothetical protein
VKVLMRDEAIKFIAVHGLKPCTQTASYKGRLVKSGTSFDEELGVRNWYRTKDVRDWLGY